MLSKVAERVYWTARYLERVESTARLISIYDQLLFDLPRSLDLSWYNLIIINSAEPLFNARYSKRDEQNVIKFMLGDRENPGSMMSSLKAIRENVRTTRDVIPEETWELTNELSMYVNSHLNSGINRGNRHAFLEEIIKGCNHILGLIYGSMPHDDAWYFMRLGRNLERADMTTRNLDAGVAAILQLKDDEHSVNSQQIIWGNVLRSLNAAQSYRRTCRVSVKASAVVSYLLMDNAFPKSIYHCLDAMLDSAQALPRSTEPMKRTQKVIEDLHRFTGFNDLGDPLRDYLNTLQIDIGQLHATIAETWFSENRFQQIQEQ